MTDTPAAHVRTEAACLAAGRGSEEGIAGNLAVAAEWLELASQLDPDKATFLPFLAGFRRALGDPREADTWERLDVLSPDLARRARATLDQVDRFLMRAHEPAPVGQGDDVLLWVLGYHLRTDGTARRRLIRRLELTVDLAVRHPGARVLVSGGATGGVPRTEASVMAAYLLERGLEPGRLDREDCSKETLENILFAQPYLAGRNRSVVLISEQPHVARAGALLDLTGWARTITLASAGNAAPFTPTERASTFRDCLRLAGFPFYADRAVDVVGRDPMPVPSPHVRCPATM